MERFDLSFNNKKIKVWFAALLPLGLIAMLLYILLPPELHIIPMLLFFSGLAIYCVWILIDNRKHKND
ncbi:hypothetical protein [Planomicrobium okeanokoites]|uniref:hypothetical protein n=1 Tax=Planomicrobium okeanokoites TaxID=244 RepID=UPI0024911804|nr:hypothetical protein [Planomicrobium okeanokoites]